MKKTLSTIFIFVILAFAFSSCSANDASNSLSETYDFLPSMNETEEAALYNETLSAARLCLNTYKAYRKDTPDGALDSETVSAMIKDMSSGNFSAVDAGNALSMSVSDEVENFGNQISFGNDAGTSYYVVYPSGVIERQILSFSSEGSSLTTVAVTWKEDSSAPEILSANEYPVSELNYTKNGWLIYKLDFSNAQTDIEAETSPYTLIRVKPYDSEQTKLCSKYIEPLGYFKNNALTVSWSSRSYGDIDLSYLYRNLYGLYNKRGSLTYSECSGLYDEAEDDGVFMVPAGEFEKVIGAYFDITATKLRKQAEFNSRKNVYMIFVPDENTASLESRSPRPEVVGFWKNTDGSITMRVEALYAWYGTDCAFTHEVTVMDDDSGGFKYISNHFYDSSKNIMPDEDCSIGNELKNY